MRCLPALAEGGVSMADRGVQERNLIQGATGPWEVVVGLEVHAQIVSSAKLFSARVGGVSAAARTATSRRSMPACRACCRA